MLRRLIIGSFFGKYLIHVLFLNISILAYHCHSLVIINEYNYIIIIKYSDNLNRLVDFVVYYHGKCVGFS